MSNQHQFSVVQAEQRSAGQGADEKLRGRAFLLKKTSTYLAIDKSNYRIKYCGHLVKLALGLYEHKDIPISTANINEDGHKKEQM